MRRFRLCVAFGLFAVLAGCGKGESDMSGRAEIDGEDEARLTSINQSLENSIAGIDRSIGGTSVNLDETKIQKMSELIVSGNCARSYAPPLFRFDRSWIGNASVAGDATCPINSVRRWDYNINSDRFIFTDEFVNRKNEYRQWDPVTAKTYTGSLTVSRYNDGEVRVSGTMSLSVDIEGQGHIDADVQTSQSYRANSGSGVLTMTMVVAGSEKYIGEIKWGANMFATYKLNGRESNRKAFEQFFSAIQLNDMLYWSEQMR